MKILIADDSRSQLMLLLHLLKSWGHEVRSTADGADALQILLDEPDIWLAILDWEMPGMNGPEICKAIRDQKHFVYLILLTGRAEHDDITHAFEMGASDLIVKPLHPSVLSARLQVVERMFDLQSQLSDMQKLASLTQK